jgi:hypothetical protein
MNNRAVGCKTQLQQDLEESDAQKLLAPSTEQDSPAQAPDEGDHE